MTQRRQLCCPAWRWCSRSRASRYRSSPAAKIYPYKKSYVVKMLWIRNLERKKGRSGGSGSGSKYQKIQFLIWIKNLYDSIPTFVQNTYTLITFLGWIWTVLNWIRIPWDEQTTSPYLCSSLGCTSSSRCWLLNFNPGIDNTIACTEPSNKSCVLKNWNSSDKIKFFDI